MADTRLVHIIDDEEPVRRSMAFMLKTSGFAVSVWENGVAFLREAKATDAGCVLLDIRMPEMDGLEVQREMAAHGIAMPVIVLTGHGDIATAVLAMRQGAIDFMEKPFEKAALLAALDRDARPARGGVDQRAGGAGSHRRAHPARTGYPARSGARASEQDHRLRPGYQRADGGGSPGACHDQIGRAQPVRRAAPRLCGGNGCRIGTSRSDDGRDDRHSDSSPFVRGCDDDGKWAGSRCDGAVGRG